jgi:copper(I)-binding protein
MRSTLAALGAASLLLVAVSGGAVAQTGAAQVKDVWARATPGAAQTAAVYATLQSAAGDRLTGVTTPAATQADLHTMSTDNGVMKMRQVDGIDLPSGQVVTLKPGGYHIMLTGLAKPLAEGQMFPLTLTFAKSSPQTVTVTVQKIGAMDPGKSMNMPGMDMPMHH